MVRDATVEAAAVDSAVLAGYLQEHEEDKDNFISLASLGPLPIFPFLFNDRLPGWYGHIFMIETVMDFFFYS